MVANPKAIAAANAGAATANGVSWGARSGLAGLSAPCGTDAGKVESTGTGTCHDPAVTREWRTNRSDTVRRHARGAARRRVRDPEP
jgi:hypothetical protein